MKATIATLVLAALDAALGAWSFSVTELPGPTAFCLITTLVLIGIASTLDRVPPPARFPIRNRESSD